MSTEYIIQKLDALKMLTEQNMLKKVLTFNEAAIYRGFHSHLYKMMLG